MAKWVSRILSSFMMGFSLLLAKSFLVPGISDSAEVPLGALGQDLVPETAPKQLRFRDVSSPEIYRGDCGSATFCI